MPAWVFLVEPPICSAGPFTVRPPGTMHPPTWGSIPTTYLILAQAQQSLVLRHLLSLMLC